MKELLNENMIAQNSEKISVNRDLSIDIAKGIAILCVIMGHNGLRIVSTFHMSLFMILSGYFMSTKNSLLEFTKNRARRLLVPYGFGVLILVVGVAMRDLLMNNSQKILSDMKMFIVSGLYGKGAKSGGFFWDGVIHIGAIWFLLALFSGSIIVRKFLDKKYMLAVVSVVAYIGVASRNIVALPWSIQSGMLGAFFIGIGFYCRKYSIFVKKCDVSILVSAFALWLFGMWQGIILSMVNANASHGLLSVFVALAGSFCVVKISQLIERLGGPLKKFLIFCGTNSLIILVWHNFEIKLFRWSWLNSLFSWIGFSVDDPVIFAGIRCIVRIFFCLFCTGITLYIAPLKKIFR